MVTQDDGAVQREQRTFSTMTADLLTLEDWLRQRLIEVTLRHKGVPWSFSYALPSL